MITKCDSLGGTGKVVEIEEGKFGKRKYARGHAIDGQWVFGGFELGGTTWSPRSSICANEALEPES